MKSKKEYSVINQHTVNRLKEYYDYNEAEKTFVIPFHYGSLDEILVNKKVTKKPKVDSKILNDIEYALHEIPDGYTADVELIIDDYQGYDSGFVMQQVKDAFLDRQFVGIDQHKRNSIKAGIITLVGICWIVLAFVGQTFGWWGESTTFTSGIITGFLNIFAAVFIWEAVSMTIIHGNPFISEFRHLLKKLRYVVIRDTNGKEEKELLVNFGPSFSYYRLRSASEYLVMVSSYAFFGFALVNVIRYLNILISAYEQITVYELAILPAIIMLMVVLGVFGILIYKGHMKMLLSSLAINSLLIVAIIVHMVFIVTQKEPFDNLGSAIFALVVAIAFEIGLVIKLYLYKKKNVF